MTTLTFDTLKHAKRLIEAGIPEAQAQAQTNSLKEAFDEVLSSEVATKGDLKDLELHLVKWVVASQVSTVVILATLFKIFS